MNINWRLPEDIIKVIFSKLPFFNLPNCRIVCKAWNHVVSDHASKFPTIPNALLVYTSDLQQLNPKMSCVDFDTTSSVATLMFDHDGKIVDIYTSCNGLFHIFKWSCVRVCCNGIWNPMTNELLKISESTYEDTYRYDYRFGFGFSPKTKQYKLFRVSDQEIDEVISTTIGVWRFGISNQWEYLGCQPSIVPHHATYLDGIIYWFGYDLTDEFMIYALDVETETFEIDVILDLGCHYTVTKLQPFNGTICLIVICPPKAEVWIRRAKHSWIREFVIDLPRMGLHRFYCIKAYEDKGDIYFLFDNNLFCFDKNGKTIEMKTLFNPNEKVIRRVLHIETFHFGSLQKILTGNK